MLKDVEERCGCISGHSAELQVKYVGVDHFVSTNQL